jgi:predicted transcriptional regulator
MVKKRERLEVIYDILKTIQDNQNHIKPTRLLHLSNLSPQMFKDYTEELLEKKFMTQEEESERRTFSVAKKGFEFLEEYKVIQNFIENFGL